MAETKTIHVHPPGDARAEAVALAEGDALLIGREPELTAGRADGAPAPTRKLAVQSALVSSNHVLVWADGAGVHARDLCSKNGTFVQLERGRDATLAGASEAHVYLSPPRPAAKPGGPCEVGVLDADPERFAARVKDAVAEWLEQQGLRPGLRVLKLEPEAPEAAASPGRFVVPLVDRLALEVGDELAGRTAVDWDSIKARLFPYAYEQKARWQTMRAATGKKPLAFRAPNAQRALREVLEAARAGLPLVLRGETGTGKSELAAIYCERSAGRGGPPPFVTVHCAHLDPPLAHSLLFGAVKGSYTSSDRTTAGAVKLADGGVLFLDDVDLLPLETQAKLLRFLDAGQFEPLGHGRREPLAADVRVVTGTNADLRAAVRERRFREDLYWRLHSGVAVSVPPLRDRPEDVAELFEAPAGEGRLRDRLDAGALEYLVRKHPWRGNFRECLRFCARVRMEPAGEAPLDRRRCEAILAETSLDEEPRAPLAHAAGDESAFSSALARALALWTAAEGAPPESFDALSRFCERYLKSAFVAHALGVEDERERPDSFDKDARRALGCDLTTVKRKIDDYFELLRQRSAEGGDK